MKGPSQQALHVCFPILLQIYDLLSGEAAGSSTRSPPRSSGGSSIVDLLGQGSSDVINAESADAGEASHPPQPSEKLDPEESAGIVDRVS